MCIFEIYLYIFLFSFRGPCVRKLLTGLIMYIYPLKIKNIVLYCIVLLVFPPKKTLICKRHCSISQSSCSVTVKAKDRLISRKFFEHEVFTPGGSLNQPKATRVCIRSTNQSTLSISVRLLFLFVRAFSF